MSIWEEDLKEIEKVRDVIESLGKSDKSDVALKHWIKVDSWDCRDYKDYEFIGVDGSFSIKYLNCVTIYLTRALALSPAIGDIKISKFEILDTVNDSQVRQHVKAVMSLLEVEAASKALIEAIKQGVNPVILFDGSLSSILLNRSPRQPSIIGQTARKLSSLIEDVEEGEVIFIAKRSSDSQYEKGFPDMMLFGSMPMGYSKPRLVNIAERYNLPEAELDRLGLTPKLKVITIFYVKLADGSPLLKFEVPGIIPESRIYDIISRISSVSPAGYPVPLLVAHHHVKLSSLTVKRALSLTGVRILSGREALREVGM